MLTESAAPSKMFFPIRKSAFLLYVPTKALFQVACEPDPLEKIMMIVPKVFEKSILVREFLNAFWANSRHLPPERGKDLRDGLDYCPGLL